MKINYNTTRLSVAISIGKAFGSLDYLSFITKTSWFPRFYFESGPRKFTEMTSSGPFAGNNLICNVLPSSAG